MSSDPTIPSQTLPSEDADRPPPLALLASVIPRDSVRHLVTAQLSEGASADGATKALAAWLALAIDWRELGVPSGQLGPRGQATLLAACRVLVDTVALARRARTTSPRVPPRRLPPDAPPVRTVDPLECPPDPADDR